MQALLGDPRTYRPMSKSRIPYGNGFASRRIVAQLVADKTGGFAGSLVRGRESG
jgi:UDP-N-acetylglucosamine 2-epimerase